MLTLFYINLMTFIYFYYKINKKEKGDFMRQMEKKNIVLYIVLTFCTFGLFGIYWAYIIGRDSTYMDDENESITVNVLLMLLFPIVGNYFCEKKLVSACEKLKMKHEDQSILLLILGLVGFPFAGFIVLQDTMNKMIDFYNNQYSENENRQEQKTSFVPKSEIKTENKDTKLDDFSKEFKELADDRKALEDESLKNENTDKILKLLYDDKGLTVRFLNERCSKEQFIIIKEIYDKINIEEHEELKNAFENLSEKYPNE